VLVDEANAYAKDCPSRTVLDRIGDTWSVLIVLLLARGSHRYSELAAKIEGISPKMLTQTLRALERDGLVTRTVHAAVPPRVDYALTELGSSLNALVGGLQDWAESHIGDVLTARTAYDGRGDSGVPVASGVRVQANRAK
jgi:DNA-binding HxlR family transcriptional regulator